MRSTTKEAMIEIGCEFDEQRSFVTKTRSWSLTTPASYPRSRLVHSQVACVRQCPSSFLEPGNRIHTKLHILANVQKIIKFLYSVTVVYMIKSYQFCINCRKSMQKSKYLIIWKNTTETLSYRKKLKISGFNFALIRYLFPVENTVLINKIN